MNTNSNQVEKVKPISKKEIAQKIAEIADLSQRDGEIVLNTLSAILIAELQTRGVFTLHGVGTFRKVYKQSTIKVNPHTQQRIQTPGKNVVKFKVAKNLKDAVGMTE